MGQEQEMGHTSEQGGNKHSAAMCERAVLLTVTSFGDCLTL